MSKKKVTKNQIIEMPPAEEVTQALAQVRSVDDFFGQDGVFAKLFAHTLEQMMEAELSEHLGYEKYEARGRNTGNSRNGAYEKTVRTSTGETRIAVPRDRNGTFNPQIMERYAANSNELEEKILGLYAKGMSTRDIEDTLTKLYGVEVSPTTISKITDKVWPLVEEWQNRQLKRVYPIVYLDALHMDIRQNGKVANTAVYVVLAIDLEGRKDMLGHWVGDGNEGANFWLSVVTDLQTRGVNDIFIACVDGLKGFKEAIQAVFPRTAIQRCIVHQIRYSLRYVSHSDQKAFMKDLKKVYRAATREEAETNLLQLGELWSDQYAMAVRTWENNWTDLATFFDYPAEIRRMIYTTNPIEGYNRQLRKVTKTKGVFPSARAVRKILYLVNENITRKWTMPVPHWPKVLNQFAIRFEDRFPM